eukprot:CAMPEP_0194372840 /NCGR_PEP_ID=MMETSP0174-20130528/21235_1 /TAXON_ID=216777 /ORGANISM="Proboscia alata, Strain PI-D3" /LENGTH=266 /DNA_ID=CAMNT_0039151577 /DNA_START=746 /DNA_END=1546 /DNA_ORIENTATION=+
MHNAMSTSDDNFMLPNHVLGMEKALDAGYRGFMLDVCDCGSSGIRFCHGVCFIGTRSLSTVFQNLVNFLDRNSDEVVILEFQMGSSSMDLLKNLFGEMQSVDRFIDMMYVHPSKNADWPLMSEIISRDKRIIAFQHNGPSCNNAYTEACPTQIHRWWDHIIATPFAFSSVNDILDFPKSCLLYIEEESSRSFLNLNHFIANSIPDQRNAIVINTEEIIKNRVSACSEMNDRINVNFITVDFWNSGDVLDIVNAYNKARSKALRRTL